MKRIVRAHAEVDWVEADAFQMLRDWSDAGESSIRSCWIRRRLPKPKRAVEGALRGYKELNLRALKMLRPGGLLVTCSCSHHVSWADLEGAVAVGGGRCAPAGAAAGAARGGAGPSGGAESAGDRISEVPGAGSGVRHGAGQMRGRTLQAWATRGVRWPSRRKKRVKNCGKTCDSRRDRSVF